MVETAEEGEEEYRRNNAAAVAQQHVVFVLKLLPLFPPPPIVIRLDKNDFANITLILSLSLLRFKGKRVFFRRFPNYKLC